MRPVAFAFLIIIIVCLPLFSLQSMEGKMFRPLALTMIYALAHGYRGEVVVPALAVAAGA